MPQTRLILRKGREQRQLQGHPWVYEGEIASVRGTPRDGGVADCYSHDEVFLGRGYFNSRSKIRLRVLTRHIAEDVDEALLRRRLSAALGRRRRLYPEAAALRLVHAEGDGLPGLTVDRYGAALVLQYASLGLDRQRATIERFLQELTNLEHLYVRNDLAPRRLDGLKLGKGFATAPFPTTLPVKMHQVALRVDVANGHKTGLYLDQADNHLALGASGPRRRQRTGRLLLHRRLQPARRRRRGRRGAGRGQLGAYPGTGAGQRRTEPFRRSLSLRNRQRLQPFEAPAAAGEAVRRRGA